MIRNIIIMLCINYIIIGNNNNNNNNNAVNNNLWKTPKTYFAFRNSHGYAKGFL